MQPKFNFLPAHGRLVFVTLGKGKANIFHSEHAVEMLKALFWLSSFVKAKRREVSVSILKKYLNLNY